MFYRIAHCIMAFTLLAAGFAARAEDHQTNRPLGGSPSSDFFANVSLPLPEGPSVVLQSGISTSTRGEKSPWLAGILSLAVPGAGEIYTESYVKAAIFLAVEGAAVFTALSYDRRGDDRTNQFQDYANAHWSAARYTNWTLDNLHRLNPNLTGDYESRIYGGPRPDGSCLPPFDCINWSELNAMERDVAGFVGNGYTHGLPRYGEQQYYELIGKYVQFYSGWDDAWDHGISENEFYPGGFRAPQQSRFFQYSRMRADANHYYDIASTFVGVIVVNHLLSAADAFWSATQYNNALHAEVKMRFEPTPIGLVPVTEATFAFRF
jgi:hypothetical protein